MIVLYISKFVKCSDSLMHHVFLKNKRHIDMLLSLPISHLRIFKGDPKWQPFGEFRTGGICRGSTAWIISCERL